MSPEPDASHTPPSARLGEGRFANPHSTANKLGRALWQIVYAVLFRPSPRICHPWRRLLLRLFGAKIGPGAHVYPSCTVWAPWNLEMGAHSCLADRVDCYCAAKVAIGPYATVSQYSFLCTASHDETDPHMRLITAPITIGERAWVCADVFVGPGVAIGEGAVVGARSSVFKDLPEWTVCRGTPARAVRKREIKEDAS